MLRNRFTIFIIHGLVALALIFSLKAGAQRTLQFSGDSTRFISELNALMFGLSDNDRKLIQPIMVSFVQKWNQEAFDPLKKQVIYSMCNAMLKKKIRVFPDFFNYIRSLNVFVESRQSEIVFSSWSSILKKLISEKNSRNFMAFLETTTNLFDEGLMYKSAGVCWKMKPPQFVIQYDSVPFIDFVKGDLVCLINKDSVQIRGTKGRLYPLSGVWQGTEGRVDWRRVELDPAEVYADLGQYKVQLRFSRITADSVSFSYKKYFPVPVSGKFVDKVLIEMDEEKASYPRFYSYEKVISIRNIFTDIDYIGGFAMEGSRLLGGGDKNSEAQLIIRRAGTDFMKIKAPVFVIRPGKINASAAAITIYHESDSIYHPSLEMKYIDANRELSFTKDEKLVAISPWFDSWHKIDIFCEQLDWIMSQPKLNFEMMRGPNRESKAVFESANYYSRNRFDRLQGMDEINILNHIENLTKKWNTRQFSLEELTKYMQKPQEQVEVQLLNLANRGFLVYDFDGKTAFVKDKLNNYVKARIGKTDYDEIEFTSTVTNNSNASLDLNTFDLKINGVRNVHLSDSQHVAIYPKNEELILKKDMDVTFQGKIEAGYFDFYGRDCSLEYGKFRLNLPSVDSMAFYVPSRTWDPKTGRFPLIRVKTVIRNLSGDLQIDREDNKSGLKALKEYPVFRNKNTAQVFYDKRYIQKGVYTRDKFFFEVDPFTLQSLDVVHTDSLNFGGALTSAGIFPKIMEPLRVRPDYSLGFAKLTPEEGLPVYGGRGTYFSRIDLSEQGLRGEGSLKFLNSTSQSKDFLFLPDSLRSFSRSFIMTEQVAAVEYPSVTADSVNQFWLPYRDSMTVTTVRKDMHMYNDQSLFSGTLALSPFMLYGNGMVKIRDAEMDSRGFHFKRRTFDALIANFRIRSYDLNDLTISTKNYQTHFDFDKRKGEFLSNVGISKVEFPLNKYVCSMDRFDWLIDNEEISLTNERSRKVISDSLSLSQLIDVAYTGSEFISVHPLQDSVKFYAARARYNLRTNVINAEDVKILKIADAAIYPDSGKIVILKDAQMQTLRHCMLLANTRTRYHQFYQADISVASRKRYTGRGLLDYTDRTGQKQKIDFSSIRVDSAGQTVANGEISDSSYFMISPEFQFRGEISLRAGSKIMDFEGGFRVITECIKGRPDWIRFHSEINPNHILIPVSEHPANMVGEKVDLSVIYSSYESRIYPAFFLKKFGISDSLMCRASGMMTYDPVTTEFRIADSLKLSDLSKPGNFISLNQTQCRLRGDGKVSLGFNSGNFFLETYGLVEHFIIPDSTRIRVAAAMNFPFPDDALNKIVSHLNSTNLSGMTVEKSPYYTAIQSILDPKELERLNNELSLTGRYKKFPDNLDRTVFLGDVNMSFDTARRSWISSGPIGIATLGKNQIYKYVSGIMEFSKKRTGDEFTIYLQLSAQDWYFFNYRNNILQVISSNLEFNDMIINARKSKGEQKKVSSAARGFTYTISTERKKRDFLKKFQKSEE